MDIEGIKKNMEKGRGKIDVEERVVGLNEAERVEYEASQKAAKKSVGRPKVDKSGWTTIGPSAEVENG